MQDGCPTCHAKFLRGREGVVLGHLRKLTGSVSSAVGEGNLSNHLRNTFRTIHSTDDIDLKRGATMTSNGLAVIVKYWKYKCMRSVKCERM